uniref:Glutamyl-tRNA reductase n=2 Tax=Lotharella globosa TaxID=91324 RepID=A0A6V3NYW5_9EUKA|mmetsp:Transcript_4569/g.8919  ORF Transcript_4569/g.8919 Transcript_4569/m.8919 type:complete len:559 (-) Transcript_4569:497-2173(-)
MSCPFITRLRFSSLFLGLFAASLYFTRSPHTAHASLSSSLATRQQSPSQMASFRPQCKNRLARKLRQTRVMELTSPMDSGMFTLPGPHATVEAPRCPVTGIALPGTVHVVGLSHHTADVSVREKLAIPEAEWKAQAARLNAMPSIEEAGILSTCNRFEVYYVSHDTEQANSEVMNFLKDKSGLAQDELHPNLFFHDGTEAIDHVLRVSSGLDSLVVGEGQILSQVKNCAAHGGDEDGSFGKVLGKLFNVAVSTGKRVRSETGISKGAVSISSAAAQLAEMKVKEDLGMDFKDARIAIIGAGEMTRLLVTHLASTNAKQPLHIVNRGRERMERLSEMFPNVDMSLHTLDEMWDQIGDADIVFTSTFSQDPLVSKATLEQHPRNGKKLMLVDISVPVNVDYDAKEAEGVVAYHVDDLKQVIDANKEKRMAAVKEAEVLIEGEIRDFEGWKQSLRCIPAIKMLREKGETIRQKELAQAEKVLGGLSQKERDTVERVTKGIIAKLLHGPMSHLRDPEEEMQRVEYKLETMQKMFQLGQIDPHAVVFSDKKKKNKKKKANQAA